MIYGHLKVFTIYAAYLTADSEATFLRLFKEVVQDCVEQYEAMFGDVGIERKNTVKSDMAALHLTPEMSIENLSYDLKMDFDGFRGIVEVDEMFREQESVLEQYQPIVDNLNSEIEAEEEKWSVFDGFFPLNPGHDIDPLFK